MIPYVTRELIYFIKPLYKSVFSLDCKNNIPYLFALTTVLRNSFLGKHISSKDFCKLKCWHGNYSKGEKKFKGTRKLLSSQEY